MMEELEIGLSGTASVTVKLKLTHGRCKGVSKRNSRRKASKNESRAVVLGKGRKSWEGLNAGWRGQPLASKDGHGWERL